MGRDGWRLYSGVCAVGFNSRARMGRDLAAGNHETARVVSIHAPAWGATTRRSTARKQPSFNSRARMGRDRTSMNSFPDTGVSIHAPAWGATSGNAGRPGRASFNSRARMGHDSRPATPGQAAKGFNSRARMGRDRHRPGRCRFGVVSIHAPAWGATAGNTLLQKLSMFQFTRPHGARPAAMLLEHHLQRFNSRARMGRDVEQCVFAETVRVSIHAPAWGATSWRRGSLSPISFQFTRPHGARLTRTLKKNSINGFNSRARMGRDYLPPETRRVCKVFQFTRPHGARPSPRRPQPCRSSFNSRARMGRDTIKGDIFAVYVSIHAPAWGATFAAQLLNLLVRVSIHAPAWGATGRVEPMA